MTVSDDVHFSVEGHPAESHLSAFTSERLCRPVKQKKQNKIKKNCEDALCPSPSAHLYKNIYQLTRMRLFGVNLVT